MRAWYHFFAYFFCFSAPSLGSQAALPSHCEYDELCVVEVPGTLCADGSPSYLSLIARKDSQDLVIYLESGGACWNKETCDNFHVQKLKRKEPKNLSIPEQGLLDLSNPENPFHRMSFVTIPYCTGDVFLGNNRINYGSTEKPNFIHHHGFKNVVLTFEKIKELLGSPQKVVLFGRSAGGLGILGHLRNLDRFFPDSDKFALSDAGTPISPPFVNEIEYQKIMLNWGVTDTLPQAAEVGSEIRHFGDLLRYNVQKFPHIRFGYIQSFSDPVMTYFVKTIGAKNPSQALKDIIVTSADQFIGRETEHAKVFFIDKNIHVVTKKSLNRTISAQVSLSNWLHDMFRGGDWRNARTDLPLED